MANIPVDATAFAAFDMQELSAETFDAGLESAADYEILSGVQEGEMVVFGEQDQYRPGQLVQPNVVNPAGVE